MAQMADQTLQDDKLPVVGCGISTETQSDMV
jgi:hypothetical protein